MSAATGQHRPMYEPAGIWTWNIADDGECVEINLHDRKRTVTLSARDVRQMQLSIDAMRTVARADA